MAAPEPHQCFVHGDAHKPCIETGVSLEGLEMFVRFEEGFLHRILGILQIPGDVPC
jgi:hypothetical protein